MLKTFVPEHEPVAIPPQNLDAISPFVDEQEQMSVEHIPLKHRLDQSAQSVETLTEVDGLAAEIDVRVVRDVQHSDSSCRSASRGTRPAAAIAAAIDGTSALATITRAPLGRWISTSAAAGFDESRRTGRNVGS